MTLLNANAGEEYIIRDIVTDDEELDAFLFSLGCYSGEPITVIKHLRRVPVCFIGKNAACIPYGHTPLFQCSHKPL